MLGLGRVEVAHHMKGIAGMLGGRSKGFVGAELAERGDNNTYCCCNQY